MTTNQDPPILCATPLLLCDSALPDDLALLLQQEPNRCLVVVNTPLCRVDVFQNIWKLSKWRMCADGGANRLYDALREDEEVRRQHIPHFIIGDLDSLRPDVSSYYASHGTHIIKQNDQNSTDLQKCITLLRQLERGIDPLLGTPADRAKTWTKSPPPTADEQHEIIVLGALNGRFDHCLASLNTPFLLSLGKIHLDDEIDGDGIPDLRTMWLLGDMSCATVFTGKRRVAVMPKVEGPTCGVVPLEGTTLCVTKGLRWDIDHTLPLHFGGMVSTSNQFNLDLPSDSHPTPFDREFHLIDIETDKMVVWTVEIDIGRGEIVL